MKRISADSREYLLCPITATVAGAPADLTADAVDVAIIANGTTVQDADFNAGDWEPGTQNARVLIGPGGVPSVGTFTRAYYDVYARVHASPELPVIKCGTIEIF